MGLQLTKIGASQTELVAKTMAPAIELDFQGIAATALSAVATLLGEWLPDGHKRGNEWVSKNPTRHDHSEGSFSVNMATGSWADFATEDRGGDLISLYAYLNSLPQSQAARDIAERLHVGAAVHRQGAKRRKASEEGWKPIVPVPSNVPEPSMNHQQHGAPSAYWTYRDADGRTLALVVRFDQGDGDKIILPLTYCRHGGIGRTAWRWKGLPAPRPLYNLNGLTSKPTASVVVVEGEKAADAAAQLLPDHVAVTSLNGSANAHYADWAPLTGRPS